MRDRYFDDNPNAVFDMHGMNREEVVHELENFLHTARNDNFEKVRIVTGKGSNSPDGTPVVRQAAQAFLNQNGYSYNFAPLFDGGEGALDVYIM